MPRGNYYNEFDPYAAQWLRNLIAKGLLPAGVVDERDIRTVQAEELAEYDQCHFFAGIGGWPLALQQANVPSTEPLWTGSCPCQPFSVSGKHKGEADERHLWPEFQRLISLRRPPTVFGEQVASADGRIWLAGVRLDLEELGYEVGAADLCAAGISAPHLRQRLFWVADAGQAGRKFVGASDDGYRGHASGDDADRCGATRRMGNSLEPGLEGHPGNGHNGHQSGRLSTIEGGSTPAASGAGRLAHSNGGQPRDGELQPSREHGQQPKDQGPCFWDAFDWMPCGDGKQRRVEPGTFPLAHGVPARVGKLRAYGNAIVPALAAEFIRAFLETKVTEG